MHEILGENRRETRISWVRMAAHDPLAFLNQICTLTAWYILLWSVDTGRTWWVAERGRHISFPASTKPSRLKKGNHNRSYERYYIMTFTAHAVKKWLSLATTSKHADEAGFVHKYTHLMKSNRSNWKMISISTYGLQTWIEVLASKTLKRR